MWKKLSKVKRITVEKLDPKKNNAEIRKMPKMKANASKPTNCKSND
jgi:hypothetical protein